MRRQSSRLDKILSMAAAEERNLGMETGRAQEKLRKANRRLGELNAYRKSYAATAHCAQGMRTAHWKDFQNFLLRLDDAIRSQQHVVQDCKENLDLHRRRWLIKRQRVESLERVRERYRKAEESHADRLEQRALDDIAGAPKIFDKD